MPTIRVQREDFDIGAELARLTAGKTDVGGLACFVGLVRDMAGAERISAMTLEHYPGMTERAIGKMVDEACARWPLGDVTVIHRYGRLEPGDRIVLVAATAPHREPCLAGVHFLIDWLKTKAPFWKLEDTASGPKWVEARGEDDKAVEKWTAG